MVYAVATIFDLDEMVSNNLAWKAVADVMQKAGVEITPLPHFSWHVASDYDFSALDEYFAELVQGFDPFPIHITGMGIFTGPAPVLYLPVTKTPQVTELHSVIWSGIEPLSSGTNPNYDPHKWIPHITLTDESAGDDAICKVINELASLPMDMRMVIDHLAVIYRDNRSSGIRSSYRFGVGEV